MSITTSDVTVPDRAEILVVEDDPDIVALYAMWLADTDCIRTATDGSEALTMIDEEVDVVLLDRKLPKCSGEEVLATIRERDLPCGVVMISGAEPDFDLVELAFDDYLVKPVTRTDVREAVGQTLAKPDYDHRLQEFCELSKKRAILEEQKTVGERESSEAYTTLEDRLAELDARLAELDAQPDDVARTDACRTEHGETTTADSTPDSDRSENANDS